MINKEIEEKFGPQCSSDNMFTRKARLLQSLYRLENIENSCGIGPNKNSSHPITKKPTYYGNMLLNGEATNKNFFFSQTFDYAQKRVQKKEKKREETIDKYRLFNNMLSSMPLAFNLFHPLMMIKEKYPEKLNKMIQHVFPHLPIYIVEEIKIEFVPPPIENYTNDKSAMDAAIFFKDEKGLSYLVAIEMKYTDSLGTNKANDKSLQHKADIAKTLEQFTDAGIKIIESGCQQIYRNYLLTEKYGKVHELRDTYSIILAPKDHPSTKKEIDSLKENLKKEFQYKIEKYDLESFIENLKLNCPEEFKKWLNDFYYRYLNFASVENLLKQ